MKYVMLKMTDKDAEGRKLREEVQNHVAKMDELLKTGSNVDNKEIIELDKKIKRYPNSISSSLYGDREIFSFMLSFSQFNMKNLDDVVIGADLKKKLGNTEITKDNEYFELNDDEYKFVIRVLDHNRYFKLVKGANGVEIPPLSSTAVDTVALFLRKLKLATSMKPSENKEE